MRWGVPAASADVVAELTPGRPALFAYDEGDLLANGSAAVGCRVAFPLELSAFSNITNTGWAFWDRAVKYAASECGADFIYTVAGSGGSGSYPGNGLPATTVSIKRPSGLDLGPNGNLVIVDTDNNAVRSVDLTTGAMTTIAGTGTAGSSGNGGPATSATLRAPLRAEYDSAGNLYIADTGNHAIRRVAAGTGIITSVAGTGTAGSSGDNGQATSARLSSPSDVAIDSAGNLLIADRGNHKVRRVNRTTGVITTVAGTGASGYTGDEVAATSSRLNTPWSVDVDAANQLYIADFNNERVRMVDTGGIMHTVAGTGIAAAGGDGGPAVEADLHKPVHVMVDPSGGIWISESNNTKVRYVDSGGVTTTIAGNTVLSFAGDAGPPAFAVMNRPHATAMDATGNVYVADRDNRRVRLILAP
jgi:sugar lactone lactonase YvrE